MSWHCVSNRLYLIVSIMFNRLRTIWPKAQWLPARKLREEPLERRLLKNKQCEKMALPWASTLVALRQGHREGDNDPGAHGV